MSSEDWWATAQLSDSQYIPLLVLGTFSSTLSLIGSSCVISMTLREDIQHKIMHRLIFGLCVADILASFSFLLSPFLAPSYLELPGAVGTHMTSAAMGFVWMFAVGLGCFYNCYLSIYYLLVVKWNFRERDFKRHWEIVAHFVAVFLPLAVNSAAAATQSINPAPALNGISTYTTIPWGCEVDCQRSNGHTQFILLMTMCVFLIVLSFTSFCCTFLVWRTVSDAIHRSNAHRFEGDRNERAEERLDQVRTQSILYSLAYLNTVFWPILETSIVYSVPREELDAKKQETGFYILMVFFWTLYPLQGALNFFIFTRLKVQQWRKLQPDRSLFWIYSQVLACRPPTAPKRLHKITNVTTNIVDANVPEAGGGGE